jgi:hypothetical protein
LVYFPHFDVPHQAFHCSLENIVLFLAVPS